MSLLGPAFSLLLGFVLVMSSDGCGSDDTRFICTGNGQQMVFWLPWIGWGAALMFSLIGAGLGARKRWTPWIGIPIGGLAYVGTAFVTYSIATG